MAWDSIGSHWHIPRLGIPSSPQYAHPAWKQDVRLVSCTVRSLCHSTTKAQGTPPWTPLCCLCLVSLWLHSSLMSYSLLLALLSPGGVLLSQGSAPQVSSALEVLTVVFGMGTRVTPPPWPPDYGSISALYYGLSLLTDSVSLHPFADYTSTFFVPRISSVLPYSCW